MPALALPALGSSTATMPYLIVVAVIPGPSGPDDSVPPALVPPVVPVPPVAAPPPVEVVPPVAEE
jgi:hypothetical protein